MTGLSTLRYAGAEVPPGKHQFWIELKDKDGRIGGGEFSFQITN
jgi:hypothetical protein